MKVARKKTSPKFRKRTIRLIDGSLFYCFVIKESFASKILMKPTDDTWEYFHLVLMKTQKDTAEFIELAGVISRPELSGNFNFDHLKNKPNVVSK